MKLPNEALLDAFNCLDRGILDAVQFCTKRFRGLVDGLSSVCLRYLHYAGIYQSSADLPLGCSRRQEPSFWYTMNCERIDGLTGAISGLEIAETEERAGERFGTMIASSYVKELKIIGVPLTHALFLPMLRFLGRVHAEIVELYYDDFEKLEPKVLNEWIHSFGSISSYDGGDLCIYITEITANLRQEHIDVLLRFNKHIKPLCDSAMRRYQAGLNRAKDVFGEVN